MSTQRETKHGVHRDDALKKEAEHLEPGREAHQQEWRQPESLDLSDTESAQMATGGTPRGTPPGMSVADVEGRSELARWLQPAVFPAQPHRLMRSARETGAPDHILELIGRLPADRRYSTVQDMWRDLGGGREDAARRS